MYIWEPHSDLVQLFADLIKVNELEDDGNHGTRCLDTPVFVKCIQGADSIQTECVTIQLRQVVHSQGGVTAHCRPVDINTTVCYWYKVKK